MSWFDSKLWIQWVDRVKIWLINNFFGPTSFWDNFWIERLNYWYAFLILKFMEAQICSLNFFLLFFDQFVIPNGNSVHISFKMKIIKTYFSIHSFLLDFPSFFIINYNLMMYNNCLLLNFQNLNFTCNIISFYLNFCLHNFFCHSFSVRF